MRHRARAKWIFAGISALLFLLIALLLNSLEPLDQAVYSLVARLQAPFFTAFFTACSALASSLFALLLCFSLVFFLPRKEYRVPLLLNLLLPFLLNLALKSVFARTRPTDVILLAMESGYSFPSGHTMVAACSFGFFFYLLRHSQLSGGKKRFLSALCLILPLLVGLSRIYLGVHFGSDVLAGFCVSAVYLVLFTAFVDQYFTHSEVSVKQSFHPDRTKLLSSFRYALEGILAGLKTERNMVLHLGAMCLVMVFGALLGLSKAEWIVCILLFGLMMMAELFNTAVETVVDMITEKTDPRAKLAKDTAAGAVLALAIAAALIGALIFLPKLWAVLHAAF